MKNQYLTILCFLSASLSFAQDFQDPYMHEGPEICRSEETRLDSIIAIDISFDTLTLDTIYDFDYKWVYSYAWDNPLLPEVIDQFDAVDLPERDVYTYDENGNLKTITDEIYNEVDMEWILTSFRENEYDENENLVSYERISYDFFTGEPTFRTREERKYDAMGNQIEYDRYRWDELLQEYYLSDHADLYYNDNNVTDSTIILRWDRVNEVFNRFIRFDYTSEENRLLTRIQYSWDEFSGEYVPFASREWNYDSDGFSTDLTFGRFINGEWISTTYYTYERDDCGDILVWDLYSWNDEIGDWELRGINTYYYSGLSDTKEILELTGTLYPNPSTSYITISDDNLAEEFQLSIISLTGQVMMTQQGTHAGQIDVSLLPAGIYSVNILSAGKYYSTKFSKL